MNVAIDELEQLRGKHQEVGTQLMIKAENQLFPCHSLYLAVLNRSLELFDGFILLARSNNYGCCMALLRMQLDNILRFYGVLHTHDMHETANAIFNGTKLSSVKDTSGNKLTDRYLVELMSKANPQVNHIYGLTSGYIHLSDQHYFHMLEKSNVESDGMRDFYIGSTGEHIDTQHWIDLVNAFKIITDGIFKFPIELEKLSKKYKLDDLGRRYSLYAK